MNKKLLGLGVVIIAVIASFFGGDLGLNNQDNKDASLSNHSTQNGFNREENQSQDDASANSAITTHNENGLKVIRDAYAQQKNNVQVEASGTVKAILKDDNEGSRHQKFILSLDNGLTVLVAHNVDLAARIENLSKGDQVNFYGEYEFSQQGGVIHWTHLDPQKHHVDGWLKHQGKTYQ